MVKGFTTLIGLCCIVISTIKIIRLSVTVGDRGKRCAVRGWRANDTDKLAGWAMTVGVVEVGVAEQYRCARVSVWPRLWGVLVTYLQV